jgi:transcriptional regulator with XRE-family HTH domain
MNMNSRIEELIREKGFRKDYIAEKLGISTRQLRKYELNESYPRLDKAFQLAALLEVKVDDLYEMEYRSADQN